MVTQIFNDVILDVRLHAVPSILHRLCYFVLSHLVTNKARYNKNTLYGTRR